MSETLLYKGDCLKLMNNIKDKSIDLILCDLPFGTTAHKWDSVLPYDLLWKSYDRIIKDDGIIALSATQPSNSPFLLWKFIALQTPLNERTFSSL